MYDKQQKSWIYLYFQAENKHLAFRIGMSAEACDISK